MKKEMKNIEEEIRKTLGALDNVAPADPKPFLFTRITAKLETKKQYQNVQTEFKPALVRLASAALVFLLIFNFLTATLIIRADTASGTSSEEFFMDQYYPTMITLDNLEQNLTE